MWVGVMCGVSEGVVSGVSEGVVSANCAYAVITCMHGVRVQTYSHFRVSVTFARCTPQSLT